MPSRPDTQSQKSAPGPADRDGVATPAMLPTPTVEASAVATAWKGVHVAFAAAALRDLAEHLAERESQVAELDRARENASAARPCP